MTLPGDHGPLLIACALGIERLALRRSAAVAHGAAGPVTVLRTGMGPEAAGRAVASALRDEPEEGGTAVVATGFCAGLVPGMHPGDLVVAEETRDASGRTECAGTDRLAQALRQYGTVHTGPLAGSAHVVRGTARAALHSATGAVAVDMESAATLRTATLRAVPGPPAPAPVPGTGAGGEGDGVRPSVAALRRPVAAVRVVVDAPGHELIRLGTLRGGISAFRVLRGILPAFLEWHRSLLLPWR
ncbi:1-hydroxy-2-methyl-2-butenyl 4-diphosphate reductase [Streptomyces ovatisporus]|uniref:1-hydroxy-2-methyl-2-butenyl 4-diphosphate reductase n=1 Tax=Streptomyces ovatisporus TaxID=1128682 RepID=A0ABV9AAQ4_9ACTN